MRRKPSASHCVKKLPLDTYSPDSVVFWSGAHALSIVSANASGTFSTVSPCSCARTAVQRAPSYQAPMNSSASPISSRCGVYAASGLRRTRIVFLTIVRAGASSNSSSTESMRKAGGV